MTRNTHNDTPHGAIAMLCTDTSPEQEKGRPGARAREGCARSRHLSKKKDGPAREPVKVVRGSVPEARIRTARRTAPERLCTKASRKQEKRRPGAQARECCAPTRHLSKNKDGPAHSAGAAVREGVPQSRIKTVRRTAPRIRPSGRNTNKKIILINDKGMQKVGKYEKPTFAPPNIHIKNPQVPGTYAVAAHQSTCHRAPKYLSTNSEITPQTPPPAPSTAPSTPHSAPT